MVEEVQQKALRVIKVAKISIHFGLFVGFVLLSCYALKNLLSGKTTFQISHEYKNISLPSMTVCVYSESNKKVLDKVLLANISADYWSWVYFNLTIRYENDSFVEKPVEDFNFYHTEKYCKVGIDSNGSCLPCISLNTISNVVPTNLKLVNVNSRHLQTY